MKKNNLLVITMLFSFVVTLSSCEVVGGIFKAGIWTGIILVALVVGVILYLVSRIGRK
jgi:hypothetical protein